MSRASRSLRPAWLLAVLVLTGACDGGRGQGKLTDGGIPDFKLGTFDDMEGADLAGADLATVLVPHDLAVTDQATGGALDPGLSLPDPSGVVCSFPGSEVECPSLQVCRYYSATDGRCESCSTCGNLHAPCTKSSECDILFQCYLGSCESFCTVGMFGCGGPVTNCVDIGYVSGGICKN